MRRSIEDPWPSDKKVIKVGTQNHTLFPQAIWQQEFVLFAFTFQEKGTILDIWEVLLTHHIIHNELKSSLPLYLTSIFLTNREF